MSPSDVTVRNGTLGNAAHFGVHGAFASARYLIEKVTFVEYEVGAISMSAGSDITIRHCKVMHQAAPKTSADGSMLHDLITACLARNMHDMAQQLATRKSNDVVPRFTDSLCRCIVLSNTFNVGLPPLNDSRHPRIARIAVYDIDFADIRSEPAELVGITDQEGGKPVADFAGNLVGYHDAKAFGLVSRAQAALSPKMKAHVRQKLMSGPATFYPVHGLDRRGHELRQKASLWLRVDMADHVAVRDLRCGTVRSSGDASAAVGVMFNACRRVAVTQVRMGGVDVTDACVSALSDERPQTGLLFRQCDHVAVRDATYEAETACACTVRQASNVSVAHCRLNAAFTSLHTKKLTLEDG